MKRFGSVVGFVKAWANPGSVPQNKDNNNKNNNPFLCIS